MKKVLAIILALCLVVTLVAACGDKNDTGTSGGGGTDAGSSSGGGDSGGASSGAAWPKEVGFYDPSYDYSQHPKFKIAYLIPTAGSFLYDEMDKAFASWAPRMNMDYKGMFASSDGSTEAFLSLIQTHCDQGFNGLLLDGIADQMNPALDMAREAGVVLWSVMGMCRDYVDNYMYEDVYLDGPLQWPFIGFDNYYAGYSMMNKLIEWKNQAWPDVPWDKVGVICVGFSGFGQLYERVKGSKLAWIKANPTFGAYSPDPYDNPKNFWLADMSASGAFDQATATQLVTQVLTTPNDIEVWLLPTAMDDMSMGAANAVDLLGLTDVSCSACFGGSALPVQWDQGVDNAWRYAEFLAQTLYAEPIICALWSMMAGEVTEQTLWPQWVKQWDKGDIFEYSGEIDPVYGANILKLGDDGKPIVKQTNNFAQALLPTAWLEKDTYAQYLAWTDLYAYGDDTASYHYGQYPKVSDINLYSSKVPVPSNFQHVLQSIVMS